MRIRLGRIIHQRELDLTISPVSDQGQWLARFSIDQEDRHLAGALVGAMVRAGAAGMRLAGGLQVKGPHHLPALSTERGDHLIEHGLAIGRDR